MSIVYPSVEMVAVEMVPWTPTHEALGIPTDVIDLSAVCSPQDEMSCLGFVGNVDENTVGYYTTGPDTDGDIFEHEDFNDSVHRAMNAAKMHEQAIRYYQRSTDPFDDVQVESSSSNELDEVLTASAGNEDHWTQIQEPTETQQSVWNVDYPSEFGQVLQSKTMQGKSRDSSNIKDFPEVHWNSYTSPDVDNVEAYADPTNMYTWDGQWNGILDPHWQNEQVAASLHDFYPESGGEISAWQDSSAQWHHGCFDGTDYTDAEAELCNWPSHAGPRYTLKQWPAPCEENQEITTFMMHNVPKEHTQHTLIEHLDELGLADTYNLIYVPIDRSTHQNMGYAFLNFVDTAAAKEGERILMNSAMMCKRRQRCVRAKGQRCWLSAAHLQGLDQNVEHYRNTSSKPLIRVDGEWTDVLPGAELEYVSYG